MGGKAVGVITLGRVPEIIPRIIAAHIEGYLDLATTRIEPLDLPDSCLDGRRMQYNAAKLIDYLEENRPAQTSGKCAKIIGLVSADIFVPIFTHVFGEARQAGAHALVSTYRLSLGNNGTAVSNAKLYERTAKVALHETGHMFNLFHCKNACCLMHFSSDIETLDAIPINFCPYCTQFFNDAFRRAGIVREKYL